MGSSLGLDSDPPAQRRAHLPDFGHESRQPAQAVVLQDLVQLVEQPFEDVLGVHRLADLEGQAGGLVAEGFRKVLASKVDVEPDAEEGKVHPIPQQAAFSEDSGQFAFAHVDVVGPAQAGWHTQGSGGPDAGQACCQAQSFDAVGSEQGGEPQASRGGVPGPLVLTAAAILALGAEDQAGGGAFSGASESFGIRRVQP